MCLMFAVIVLSPGFPLNLGALQQRTNIHTKNYFHVLLPLMVDTQTRQSSNSFSLDQILQTDGAFSAVFAEHVRCT